MPEMLYVLGHPVAHSKSPVMHNAAYRALGLDWEYGFADCPTDAEAKAFLERSDWLALNITMPFKPLALRAAAESSEAARLARGANVLVRAERGLVADNTDGTGCISYLQRCGVSFAGASVVVCGTGPTSLSIMHAAACAGAARVSLLGRNANKAHGTLDGYLREIAALEGRPVTEFASGSYAESPEALRSAHVIIDATPLGMQAGDPAPFDTGLLSSGQAVFDVVYGHGETALVGAARRAGCATYDGAGMLVAQAVETVRDISRITGAFEISDDMDLFAIMADAFGGDAEDREFNQG